MIDHLLERKEGLDLSVLDKIICVALVVTDKVIKLDQQPYTKRIIIEGMGSCHVREVSTPLNPETERAKNSSFLYDRISGMFMFLAGMMGLYISWSVREPASRVFLYATQEGTASTSLSLWYTWSQHQPQESTDDDINKLIGYSGSDWVKIKEVAGASPDTYRSSIDLQSRGSQLQYQYWGAMLTAMVHDVRHTSFKGGFLVETCFAE